MAVNKLNINGSTVQTNVPQNYISSLPQSRVNDLAYSSANSSYNPINSAREASAFLTGTYNPSNVAPAITVNPVTEAQLGREAAIASSGNNGAGSASTSKTPTTTNTSSGGSSSSGSTQAVVNPSVSAGYDYASMMQSMLAQQRAAAEAAYNNAMGRLQSAWGETQNALRSNLDNTLNNLQNQYDYSSDRLNADAAKSLRESYINYMLNKKNLNQGLSAMGLSGGATESTQANMYNNYGNARNNINTTLADNLASLLNNWQNNVASANQLYNTQYADAINNFTNNINALESALANNIVSTYSGGSLSNLASFANQLGQLTSNLASAQYTPTQNTLGVNAVNTTQANDMGSVTDYAKYLASLQAQGMSSSQAIQEMTKAGYTPQQILAAFNS